MFGAFAGSQPFAAHAQQLGDFIETGQGHAALEPVVDVLRRDFALRSKIGRREAALVQQGFETITGRIHEVRV
ncbi:hypothetical protein D3C77_629560 [compost metagenome]